MKNLIYTGLVSLALGIPNSDEFHDGRKIVEHAGEKYEVLEGRALIPEEIGFDFDSGKLMGTRRAVERGMTRRGIDLGELEEREGIKIDIGTSVATIDVVLEDRNGIYEFYGRKARLDYLKGSFEDAGLAVIREGILRGRNVEGVELDLIKDNRNTDWFLIYRTNSGAYGKMDVSRVFEEEGVVFYVGDYTNFVKVEKEE